MKNVILEYAGSAIALLGTLSFLGVIGQMFLGKGSVIATLIAMVLGGL